MKLKDEDIFTGLQTNCILKCYFLAFPCKFKVDRAIAGMFFKRSSNNRIFYLKKKELGIVASYLNISVAQNRSTYRIPNYLKI